MADPLHAPAEASGRLAESAYEQIRRRILDNVWPPGHRALEQEVALALGMSRTPVREALIRLQAEGLVEVIPRHGMHVLPVSPTQMREIYEVLTGLESVAVGLVTRQGRDAAAIEPLLQATAAMDRALAADDLDAWAAADEAFHAGLIDLCRNATLKAAVMSYWDRSHRARMFSLRLRPRPVHSTREHRALVERILAGDVEGAIAENRAHRERASKELLAIFQQYKLAHL